MEPSNQPGKVRFYKDESNEWRWRAVANNNEIVAVSSEGYERLDGALNGLEVTRQIMSAESFTHVIDEPGHEEGAESV